MMSEKKEANVLLTDEEMAEALEAAGKVLMMMGVNRFVIGIADTKKVSTTIHATDLDLMAIIAQVIGCATGGKKEGARDILGTLSAYVEGQFEKDFAGHIRSAGKMN